MLLSSLYQSYGKRYPEMIYDIIDYLYDNSRKPVQFKNKIQPVNNIPDKSNPNYYEYYFKSWMDVSNEFKDKYKTINNDVLQPKETINILEILYNNGLLDYARHLLSETWNYDCYPHRNPLKNQDKPTMIYLLNCIVYGWEYIYAYNKENVKLLTVKMPDTEPMNGTCFFTKSGIVTANQCNRFYQLIEREFSFKPSPEEFIRKN
jgi:hypothetical protein